MASRESQIFYSAVVMIKPYWKGIALSLVLASVSVCLAAQSWFVKGVSPLIVAIVLGMVLGNTLYPRIAAPCQKGVNFAKAYLLRAGIILYGLNVSVQQIIALGWAAVFADMLVIVSTVLLAYGLGRKWLNLDKESCVLIGAGAGICGAAAVMATESVLKNAAEKTAVAVATVVIFGTISMFLYPQMYAWGISGLSAADFGKYIGLSVHEVAQVYVAAEMVAPQAVSDAVTMKMIRVMLLAPFLLVLSYCWQRHSAGIERQKIALPYFALGFIAAALFASIVHLPPALMEKIRLLDTWLLAAAMAALGLSTHWSVLKKAGVKPLLLSAVLWLWLMGFGLVLTLLFLQ